jgi:peptidoglycan/LPS O-acetylase OafA/YrhL
VRSEKGYRADIDGLRAVAVLAVIGFHAFPARVPGGFTGVDVFFVISGYLISTIIFTGLAGGRFSFATFYARRIKRIFPALATVLVACFAAGWFLLYATPFAALGKHIAGGAGFVSNFVLWREAGYFDADADTKPLLHLWSLGIEEQFYLVWPLMAVVAWRARMNLLALTMLVFVVSFALNIEGIRRDLVGTFYSPWRRFWELTAGSMLAAFVLNHETRLGGRARDLLGVAGMALVIAGVAGIDRTRHFPGLWALIPVTGTFLLIVSGPGAWVNRVVLSHRAMVGIGLISYPLYLWHWPLLSFARLVESETPAAPVRVAAILASFVLAWLTYRLIETPIRFGPRRAWVVPMLCIAMAACFGAGYYTFSNGGFVERPLNRTDQAYFLKYYESIRAGIEGPYRLECDFMRPGDDGVRESIPASCTSKGAGRTLFLWGDSYAQALSPGLQALLAPGDGLAQVATSGCRPSHLPIDLDVPGGRCTRANQHALARIDELDPDVVILAQRTAHDATDWAALASQLRRLGARDVLVVGPTAEWLPSLPVIVTAQYWGRSYDRVGHGLNRERLDLDRRLQAQYADSPVLRYVSLIETLCANDDCLAVVPGSNPPELVAFDAGHFTPDGSRFVVNAALRPHLARR